jgi:hypothetical protein
VRGLFAEMIQRPLTPIFTPTDPNTGRLRPTCLDEEPREIPLCQGILRHQPVPGLPLADLEQRIRLTGRPRPSIYRAISSIFVVVRCGDFGPHGRHSSRWRLPVHPRVPASARPTTSSLHHSANSDSESNVLLVGDAEAGEEEYMASGLYAKPC